MNETQESSFSPTGTWAGPVIDTDVRLTVGSVKRLFPYIKDRGWVDWILSSSFREPPSRATVQPPGAANSIRPEWRSEGGKHPVTDLATLQRHLLDSGPTELAIVDPYWGLDGVRHPELAAQLARALNDWVVGEFLDRDPRLRGTITVVHHDPAEAVREIERVGGHPGFVQVALPVWSQLPWGRRIWHPLFEAIARHDLVAVVQYGGVPDGPPTPTGHPSYFVEQFAAAPQIFLTQLISIIAEGVFEAVPDLRMTFQESGFTWLPGAMWRMTKEWKGLRRDIPWVNRPPASIVREHIRVSVPSLDGMPAAELAHTTEWLGTDQMLMYGSGYPRVQPDEIETLRSVLTATAQQKLMADNARAHYRISS
ncbi:MAG: amidohydrolase [Hyphomicrobiales bacterium]|nr:MAG: amidohydrolase [Hyphomicrobiales bacterium]